MAPRTGEAIVWRAEPGGTPRKQDRRKREVKMVRQRIEFPTEWTIPFVDDEESQGQATEDQRDEEASQTLEDQFAAKVHASGSAGE
jgi:hypothetical protein